MSIIKVNNSLSFDTSWQYFASKYLAQGSMIYKDYNVVNTPLFYIINSIFLTTNDSIYMFNLSIACMNVFYYITLLLIIKETIKKHQIGIAIFFIFSNLNSDYNVLLCAFYNIGILIFFKMLENKENFNKKNGFLLSVICVLMVLSKHTMGGFLTIMFFIMLLVLGIKKHKKYTPIITFCGLGILQALTLLFIAYKLDLIEYLIDNLYYGVLKFSNYSSILEYSQNVISNYALAIFVLLIFNFILSIVNKKEKNIYFSCFCAFQLLFMYPIANNFHILLILPLTLINLYSMLTEYINIDFKKIKKYILTFATLVFLPIIIVLITQEKPENKEREIVEYIKENEENNYYSIDALYSLICIQTKQEADKELYIYLHGNCGTRDYIEIIKEYENRGDNNYMYLYNDEKDVFWQTPLEGREYIKTNYEKVKELKYFDIYKIP